MGVEGTCVALTLLFGCSDKLKEAKKIQQEKISQDGQEVSANIVYLKQYVGNACGTIAACHCMMNVIGNDLDSSTPIGKFHASISGKSPEDAGAMLADASDLHTAS